LAMVFDRFTPEGVVFFKPSTVPDWETRTMPIKGRFYSAHFAFTVGKFCNEVPHDPRYYFHGEEITIGVRAFTHGYDIFHPHRIVAYHEFSRDYRPDKHWDTYTEWGKHNAETYSLMKGLLGIDGESCSDAEKYGKYGLGNKRSIEDWQIFAGVNFSNRNVQQETIDGCIPPNDPDGNWSNFYKHCLNIDKDKIPQDNIEYIAVALHDKDDNTLYRKDISGEELNTILSGDVINIWVEGEVATIPDYYVVWPYSTIDGWCERLTGNL